MRRFIKTMTVRRHVQYVVVQDGNAFQFAVLRWAAEDTAPEELCHYGYRAGDHEGTRTARLAAIREVARLVAAEERGRAEMHDTP